MNNVVPLDNAATARRDAEPKDLMNAVERFIAVNEKTWEGVNPTEYLNAIREREEDMPCTKAELHEQLSSLLETLEEGDVESCKTWLRIAIGKLS